MFIQMLARLKSLCTPGDLNMAGHDYPGITLDLRDLERSRLREPTLHYPIGLPESYGAESAILPIRELAMLMLMDNLTDKPNWHEKVFDESIVAKWREEALSQSEDALFERIMDGKSRHDIPKPKIRIVSKQAFDFVSVPCLLQPLNKMRTDF